MRKKVLGIVCHWFERRIKWVVFNQAGNGEGWISGDGWVINFPKQPAQPQASTNSLK